MRFRTLFKSLVISLALFVLSVNAQDKTVAVAHVIYAGNSLYYADNESTLKYKLLKKEDDGTFTINFTAERLENGKSDIRKLRFGLGCTDGVCDTDLNASDQKFLSAIFPNYEQDKKDSVISETWITLNSDGTIKLDFTKPDIPAPKWKYVRFLAPWTNTNAIMFVDGGENLMSAFSSDTCGWFQARVNAPDSNFNVYFKQTLGDSYVGKEGVIDEKITEDKTISLTDVAKSSDIIWVLANQFGEPEVTAEFPDQLGDCPIKNLPVMMFDWYDGSVNSDGTEDGFEWPRNKPAGRNGFDARGVPMYGTGTSIDFGNKGCEAEPMKGMVKPTLDSNFIPLRVDNFPSNCTNAEHLDSWFLPEVLAKDEKGNEYTNSTCREIELTLDDEGFWFAQIDDESPEGGLFLLDDFRWLDDKQTIENPYYDSLPGLEINGTRKYHNYGFTMKIQAEFKYIKGQYFEFLGDDDVWVFIDNRLVVDIGGQHQRVDGAVNLDTIGRSTGDTLVPGNKYSFFIFYAERKREASNFKMRTSIDLKVESSMFLADLIDEPDSLIQKEVWQRILERVLPCDYSSDPEKVSVERGPSDFVLFGKSLPNKGVPLNKQDSAYYSGITVSNNYTLLTIDVKTMQIMQTLPPGNYYIRVSLKNKPKEYVDVYFTIQPYELPTLTYATISDSVYCELSDNLKDSICYTKYWNFIGGDNELRTVNSDTLPINLDRTEKMWAGRIYPVNVTYIEDWSYIYTGVVVNFKTSTPALVPCDSIGNPINELVLDSGRGTFYIKGTSGIKNGTLTILTGASKNKTVDWTNITMWEPPVPQVETSYIYDRNGDGRADKIYIKFNKPIGDNTVLDSLFFTFNTSDSAYKNPTNPYANTIHYTVGEDSAIVEAPSSFGSAIYTGGKTKPLSGQISLWYTYKDTIDGTTSVFPAEGPLIDKVGPVITAAKVETINGGNTQLTLTFSEGLEASYASVDFFRFHRKNTGGDFTNVKQPDYIAASSPNQWILIFTKGTEKDFIPTVGDSVRFTPPSQNGQALDLVGVGPHEQNPWIRITGEQNVRVTSPSIIDLDPHNPAFDSAKVIIENPKATVPKLVSGENSVSAKQVASVYGTQGHFLGTLDMAELVENEIAEIIKEIQNNPTYTDGNSITTGTAQTLSIEDIVTMLSNGQTNTMEAKDRFGLSDIIIDAYDNGLLTPENVTHYAHGTTEDKKFIVASMADKTELRYRTTYYTSLGHFVNTEMGSITCNDDIFKQNGSENCLGNDGRLYLAWNMRSKDGRLVGTGIYIARLEILVRVNTKEITNRTQDFLWGVRHGRLNIKDFDIK